MDQEIVKEITTKINKRNTIIRYTEQTDVIKFMVSFLEYKEHNKRKLKAFAIKHKDYAIIDEEYNNFINSNNDIVYCDNQPYTTHKTFKPKSKLKKAYLYLVKKNRNR